MPRRRNELKILTLEIFSRSGPIRPAEYMVRTKFYPIQAADRYLRRLTRMGLLRRAHDAHGRYLYMLSDSGAKRLEWFRSQDSESTN